MKHKDYIKKVLREKALLEHNKKHRDHVDPDCRYCEIFPKAIFAVVS